MIESGQRILATDYNNAIERIEIYTLLLNSILEDYDAILTPQQQARHRVYAPQVIRHSAPCGHCAVCQPLISPIPGVRRFAGWGTISRGQG